MRDNVKIVLLFPFVICAIIFSGACVIVENAFDFICDFVEKHF